MSQKVLSHPLLWILVAVIGGVSTQIAFRSRETKPTTPPPIVVSNTTPLVEKSDQQAAWTQADQERFDVALAKDIILENENWIFLKQGDTWVLNADGTRILSPAGRWYMKFTDEAAQSGITTPRAQHSYAMAKLQTVAALVEADQAKRSQRR
jgi:hypothetical protein